MRTLILKMKFLGNLFPVVQGLRTDNARPCVRLNLERILDSSVELVLCLLRSVATPRFNPVPSNSSKKQKPKTLHTHTHTHTCTHNTPSLSDTLTPTVSHDINQNPPESLSTLLAPPHPSTSPPWSRERKRLSRKIKKRARLWGLVARHQRHQPQRPHPPQRRRPPPRPPVIPHPLGTFIRLACDWDHPVA